MDVYGAGRELVADAGATLPSHQGGFTSSLPYRCPGCGIGRGCGSSYVTWSSRRRGWPDAPASGPPTAVGRWGLVVSLGCPVTRVRPPPSQSNHGVCTSSLPSRCSGMGPGRGCGYAHHTDAASSLPSRCCGNGAGRGCGAAGDSRITGFARRRCRPGGPASASAAVAGTPIHTDATSPLPPR